MSTSEAVAGVEGNCVAVTLKLSPKLIAVALSEFTSDANVVGNEEAVGVGDAPLLIEGNGYRSLFDFCGWVGEGGYHEAGCHEGENDGLDRHGEFWFVFWYGVFG